MKLAPWREIATLHPDVAAGRYRQAGFAADLPLLLSAKAEAGYQDPAEFFARTYLTKGMRLLISLAVTLVVVVVGTYGVVSRDRDEGAKDEGRGGAGKAVVKFCQLREGCRD